MLGLAHLEDICEISKAHINQAKKKLEVWLIDSVCQYFQLKIREFSHMMF